MNLLAAFRWFRPRYQPPDGLDEPILPDSYPVYAGQLYVADGRVIESPATGTVADLKQDDEINAWEVRRCDIAGRGLAKPQGKAMSILSKDCDGLGFFWAYLGDDYRQINVRLEHDGWVAYVHGDRIGVYTSKADAEDGAIAWIRANPQAED